MKKIILLFFFFITLGCASTSTVMKSDKIKIGTNQVDFCNKFGLFTGGPCASTFMDGYNNGVKGVYYDRFVSTDQTIEDINNEAHKLGYLNEGDFAINITSMPVKQRGMANTMRITSYKNN